ncbi:unnamed protein product [Anisakis simplex]|uniref:tRNA (uracil(54)-C(5))-methyltransferase n=1 Tax=Anisakis simplex TaxID=6269 RepID=A0A0M3KDP1_ANISI|nr:unnamed protein product [Anisakis simplex]
MRRIIIKEDDKKRGCEEAHSDVCEEVAKKKAKTESDVEMSDKASQEGKPAVSSQATVLLDVCCGTGTIGLCLMSLLRKSNRLSNHYLVGIEMVPEAVEDAKVNAETNHFKENECRFVAAKAEDAFRRLSLYLPSSMDLNEANVIGILDPPRAGIHEKVVVGCRTLASLKRLIFVSCEPSQALKNLTDLCRPSSKKYAGEAFRLTSITPVDMFPQTKHCEWVIQLDR